jgi:hypothetical protein
MNQKALYDFAERCVARLGELVGKMKEEGRDRGFTDEQIRKIWITAFEVLSQKQCISRQRMSQNLHKKKSHPSQVA